MAVEYGKYADINEGTLSSDASSLLSKLSSSKSELNSFQGTLTDDIWKAGAKATLFEAFGKLNSEVYANLEADLGKIVSIAGEIGKYKTAEGNAKTQQGYIDEAESNKAAALRTNPNANVSRYDSAITRANGLKQKYEKEMQDAIDAIDSLNS